MLNDRDIGWLAGILDGEGCLQVILSNRSKQYKTGCSIAAEVRIEATSITMFDKVRRVLDALGVQYKFGNSPLRKMSTRPIYRLSVYRIEEVMKLLGIVRDSLTVKQAEADTIIAWFNRWPDQRRKGVQKATLPEKEAFYATMRELKKVA